MVFSICKCKFMVFTYLHTATHSSIATGYLTSGTKKIIDTNYNTSGISRKFSLYQTMCIIVTFYKSSTMHKENNRQFLCLYRTK